MSGERLVFGVFELDVASGDLRRAGLRLRLPPQPAKLLLALLARPGEVVSREELRRVLWEEGTFVDFEHGLNFCVNQLRRVLGDVASRPRLIETVPRAGYRFLGPVTRVGGRPATTGVAPALARGRLRWPAAAVLLWLGGQAGGGSLPAPPSHAAPRVAVREAYLRGLHLARQGGPQWSQATGWLERAVVEEPGFGPAQAALAAVYLRLAEERVRPAADVLPLARAAARAAVAADPASAEAHLWAGRAALHGDWDWDTAGREIRRALVLDPSLTAAHRAHAVYLSGRGDDAGALREIEEARRLDPLCPVMTGEAAWYRYRAGQPDEAATLWRAAAGLRADVGLHESLLFLHRAEGRPESAAAEALWAMRVAGVPERTIAETARQAPGEVARAYLRGAIRWLDGQGPAAPPERIALLHAALGEADAALAQLARAGGERSFGLPRALRDPLFDGLRSHARFRDLAARVGVSNPAS